MTDTTQFDVEYVVPDSQLVVSGTEEELGFAGVDVLAAELADGRWMAWVPHHERDSDERQTERRAIAANKHVAGGAIYEHYWGETDPSGVDG